MDELHVDVFGAGDPAIFVHGSFGWGLDTFPEQRALSDEYRIILVDRRGFAGSSSLEPMGCPKSGAGDDVAAVGSNFPRHPRSVALPTRLKGTRDRWHENAQHADREC